jgi:hypothetical protein
MELPPDRIRELRDLWETVELRSRELTDTDLEERADAPTETSTAPDEPEGESRRDDEDAETPAEATSQRVNETRTARNYLPPFDEPKEKSWIP